MVETTSEEGDSNALAKISSPALAAESKPNERYVVSIRREQDSVEVSTPRISKQEENDLDAFRSDKSESGGLSLIKSNELDGAESIAVEEKATDGDMEVCIESAASVSIMEIANVIGDSDHTEVTGNTSKEPRNRTTESSRQEM
jgi:hypothetical protein